MNNPISTYRIQFHKDFNFDNFEKVLPYLEQLGISTVYASPIFEATPGSQHGYDGVNPNNINPEVGTEEQLRKFSKRLKDQGISWLQDIVPNHMAFHSNNEWFMDVLEKGPQSKYASFFDVAWTGKLYHGRIMVPFLGSTLSEVINNDELTIQWNETDQRMVLNYYDSHYPLQPKSYSTVLQASDEELSQALKQLVVQIPKMEEEVAYTERWNEFRLQLAALMKNERTKAAIDKSLEAINKDKQALRQIVDEQSYRLCHWQETDRNINFRRFFTVNSLICLNIHNPQVFELYHTLVKKLVSEGIFQGLRIDHIDGLYDPTDYLDQLRNLVGEETYIIVEKILEPGEGLPTQWPIEGSTGYDFLSMVNNLFTNKESEQAFTKYYQKLTGDDTSIHQQLYDKKSYILYHHMKGELENLYRMFMQMGLAEKEEYAQMRTEDIRVVIAEFLIQCPVYRYYGHSLPLDEKEAEYLRDIFGRIKKTREDLTPAVDLLEKVLLVKPKEGNERYNRNALRFYQRCMQFTGPLMAKGVEDTLMYTYNRFIGHNEVGDSPEAFGHTPETFHQMMKDRQDQWPLSINTTSTHDTKRGEDVRARLNVLTDLSDEWFQLVEEWRELNADLKKNNAPDANDEYFIYQTLVGAYPMPGQDDDNIKNRMEEYLEKALREAKVHSNWTEPNTEYEEAAKNFATSLLETNRPFWKSFEAFHTKVADFGMLNSLSQVLLKFTCPGVPDVYQGTELWDLSLVDPDNRRYVDYERRQKYLDEIESADATPHEALATKFWEDRYTAQIKLWLTHHLMNERKHNAELFEKGEYIPLKVEGEYKENVFAFARKHENNWLIVAVPLHAAQLSKQQDKPIEQLDWKDTKLIVPIDTHEWENLLLKTKGKQQNGIELAEVFKNIPIALLKMEGIQTEEALVETTRTTSEVTTGIESTATEATFSKPETYERGAGVLMHITSLPSPFGIGDMGPEAITFANFLHRTHQKFWQLLPINPTEQGQGHSPYSAVSSRAGNTLLISPELLAQDGLLHYDELPQYHIPNEGQTNYKEAERVKKELFKKAWDNYKNNPSRLEQQFKDFCNEEDYWLNDFALYSALKKQNGGKAWYQWDEEYKLRDDKAIKKLKNEQPEELEYIKWLQFIFAKQWWAFRSYCNERNVKLIGDLPFYVSYDSVDVWSNQEIFCLDEEGKMTSVAGTPPDAFSADGQLWGMPIFKWDVLQKQNFKWWVNRLRKNIELFDLVRLDHFRAFSAYWDVPAGEQTAKHGQWKPCPGAELFKTVLKELGSLPFIAEDLGDIDEPVYELRDRFKMPGMAVLLFAFGDSLPQSIYIPHNYIHNSIAYTGTHDNNTVRGWYRQEANQDIRHQINQYAGANVTEENIHLNLGRLAYASVAKTAILPIQDILGIDESGRMNTPASTKNNWGWRLLSNQVTEDAEHLLREWTWLYNRK